MGMTSTSQVMLCSPQKSSISWVSGMPPIVDPDRLWRCAHKGDVAVAIEQAEICVDIVIGGDGVEDEIEAAGVLLHFVSVAGYHDFVGAEAKRVFLLIG